MRASGLSTLLIAALLLAGCATTGGSSGAAEDAFVQGRAAYRAQDYQRALPLLRRAAATDDPRAQYALGYLYYEGLGTEADLGTALSWFRRAARNGSESAVEALAIIAAAGGRLEPPQAPAELPGAADDEGAP